MFANPRVFDFSPEELVQHIYTKTRGVEACVLRFCCNLQNALKQKSLLKADIDVVLK